jgi:glyoxylase-like metal-dependent hydrolase (beta-lactamase superfamily II)
MNLIWLGHSAFRIELGAAVILIDPFLSGNPKFTGDAAKAAAGATHILLTHGHDDHIGDAANIAKPINGKRHGQFFRKYWKSEHRGLSVDRGRLGLRVFYRRHNDSCRPLVARLGIGEIQPGGPRRARR